MSKANCCCGLSPSAAAERDNAGSRATQAARHAIQTHFRENPTASNILLSQLPPTPDEFRQVTCSLASYQARPLGPAIRFGDVSQRHLTPLRSGRARRVRFACSFCIVLNSSSAPRIGPGRTEAVLYCMSRDELLSLVSAFFG